MAQPQAGAADSTHVTAGSRNASLPDVFAPVLARLQADAAAHFGDGPLRLVPDSCQERPFSQVIRLGVYRSGDRPISQLFLKVTRSTALDGDIDRLRERVARDFATTQRVHALMQAYGDLGTVRPIACYPEHLAIVTEEVEGQTLLDYLERTAAWFPSAAVLTQVEQTMTTVGQWVRVFQGLEGDAGHVSPEELIRYVDHRLTRLVQHARARFSAQDRTAVLRHFEWLSGQLAPADLVAIQTHADLSLGNVIVSGPRVVVLDFAMTRPGSRLHDLTRLSVQLDLLGIKPRIRMSVIRRLQRALLSGFDPTLTADHPLFRLLTLLHRINHFASVSVRKASPAAALYNGVVRRSHRRWLANELDRRSGAETT